MNRRKADLQLELFRVPEQPRAAKAESEELYDAVVRLRRIGVSVYRLGKNRHLIRRHPSARGSALGTAALFAMADRIGTSLP